MSSSNDNRGGQTLGLLGGERRWSAGTPPKDVTGWAVTALIVSILVLAASYRTLTDVQAATVILKVDGLIANAILVICGLVILPLIWPAIQSWRQSAIAKAALTKNDLVDARVATAASRDYAYYTLGFAAAIVTLL